MIVHFRILPAERAYLPGKIPDLIGFGQPEKDIAAGDVIQRHKLLLDLVRHAHQVLRAAAQQPALLGQPDAEAVPCKQFSAQLILQALHGLGQRRLRYMKKLRSTGHVFLPGGHKKIPQRPDFHGRTSSSVL